MFTGGKIQKPAAFFFMLLLILSISGVLAYFLWFSRIPAPPQRSRPVLGVITKLIDNGGNSNAYRSQGN